MYQVCKCLRQLCDKYRAHRKIPLVSRLSHLVTSLGEAPDDVRVMYDITAAYSPLWYGMSKPIGCLVVIGDFLQKSSIISSSFAENHSHLKKILGLRHPAVASDDVPVTYDITTIFSHLW